ATRPFPDAHRAGLSRSRSGTGAAGGRRTTRHDRRTAALPRTGGVDRAAAGGAQGACGARADGLHPGADRTHAPLARLRQRPESARRARPTPLRACLGLHRRSPQRLAGSRAGRIAGCCRTPSACGAQRRGAHAFGYRGRADRRRPHSLSHGAAAGDPMFAQLLHRSQLYRFLQAKRGRTPAVSGPVYLSHRRVYILPTRAGLAFAVSLLLMLIGSINYQLSLGYMMTFLLAGTATVAMLHTYRNLVHVRIEAGKVEDAFAGDEAYFHLHLHNPGHYERIALEVV